MQTLAIGLRGCYFGVSLLVLSGAAIAFSRSMYCIGVNASLATRSPVLVVTAFLSGQSIANRDDWLRFLAHITAIVGALLVYQLLNVLGSLKTPSSRIRTQVFFAVACAIALGASWFLTPANALRR